MQKTLFAALVAAIPNVAFADSLTFNAALERAAAEAPLLRRVGTRVATASAAKYVPIVGSGIAAAVSFGAMNLVGNSHIDDCYRTAKTLL